MTDEKRKILTIRLAKMTGSDYGTAFDFILLWEAMKEIEEEESKRISSRSE